MAQRDIEAIAEEMRLEEEEKRLADEARERALEEQRELEAEEFEELEDEIIDPASMGFIDQSEADDACESDAFYSEDDEAEQKLAEDVSDCVPDEAPDVDESEEQASVELEVYNEDGFGEHFAAEVMKNVPGVTAKTKKKALPNGDIIVVVSGARKDLERAYAFYVGKKSYASLPQEDKEEFESLLVFNDGDTLAEADYREAVAHCLDPVGVKASTANLAAQDICALSIVKEERAKRSAKRMLKALCEEDMSKLSDRELEQLDGIQDALASGEGTDGMTPDERRVWQTLLKTMGYTQEEWDKMTPEQQDKAFKADAELSKQLSKSRFARWQTEIDPETGKMTRVQHQWTGLFTPGEDKEIENDYGPMFTQFNPDYVSEISPHQHPKTYDKAQREAAVAADKANRQRKREEFARKAMLHGRHGVDSETGKPSITAGDFGNMLTALSPEEVEKLKDDLLADVRATAKSPADAEKEEKFIKALFSSAKNKKTYVDLGNIMTGGVSGAPAVKKFINDFDDAIFYATMKVTGKDGSKSAFLNLLSTPAGAKKLALALSDTLNSRRTGKTPMDPERAMRREEWKKMVKFYKHTPTTWAQLPMEDRVRMTKEYLDTQEQK